MDRRTDGQADASTMAKTREALHALARKNYLTTMLKEYCRRYRGQ